MIDNFHPDSRKKYPDGFNPSFLRFQNSLFILRPIEFGDLEFLFSWRTDPEVNKYLSSPPPVDIKEQKLWHQHYLGNPEDLHFMVLHKPSEGTRIGYCQLISIDSTERTAEFGVVVSSDYIGTGTGFKLIMTFIRICLCLLNLNAIYACVHTQNDTINKFFIDYMKAELMEGKHKYRKANQYLYKVDAKMLLSLESDLLSRSMSWKRIMDVVII